MPIITSIEVKEIKGISEKEFKCHIVPNKPNLFVAPNGFGKSSLAVAFESLKRNGMSVQEESIHKASKDSKPEVTITLSDGRKLKANSESNDILNEFSVFVINSQLYSKASTRNIGKFTATSSSIRVKPITLINTIPEKVEITYSYTDMKAKFGESGKLLINLQSPLKNEKIITKMFGLKNSFDKILQVRKWTKVLKFLEYAKSFKGTKTNLIAKITDFSYVKEIDELNDIKSLLTHISPETKELAEKYINAIQLVFVYQDNKQNFLSISKYYDYIAAKSYFDEIISSFDATWKNVSAKKKGHSLCLELPPANSISNGERDILCFIGKLFEARHKLVKDKCILIIDEIFDYLDDANLIAAQYFINGFIQEFTRGDKKLYPIILTHLDPQYFKTYCFDIKNVHYLNTNFKVVNRYNINNLLKNRDSNENISKYFLHYHPESVTEEESLSNLGINPLIYNASDFRRVANEELNKYKNGQKYDVAFVCTGIRIKIEENIYDKLENEYKQQFLDTHTTTKKLDLAKENGVEVPEIYYLLGIIYNEGLHLDPQCKKLIPVGLKLQHNVIRKMISDI